MSEARDRRSDSTPDWVRWCADWCGFEAREGESSGSGGSRVHQLQDRFDTVGWGLIFLFFGALALPSGTAEYASLAVVGGLMLLLNAVRVLKDAPVRWSTLVLGAASLVGGSAALLGEKLDAFVILFVVAGLVTIAGALLPTGRRWVA